MINRPYAVAFYSAGNMFIAEGNHIRKVSNGIITTVAGTTFGFSGDNGPATAAQIGLAEGIAVDGAGNIYIADTTNNRIRKVSGGIITTIAGNGTPGFAGDGGPAASAQLCVPRGLTIDPAGNLYFADSCNARVRKISNGVITTVAGNGAGGFGGDGGPATSAAVSPTGVAIGPGGDLFISDGNRIRKVSAGIITTIAGGGPNSAFTDNSPAASAQLFGPVGLTVTAKGSVYFAEPGSGRVRVLNIDLPSVNPGGIVPLYSTLSVIQPGSWISIFGRSFADGNYAWSGDFPTSLGGVSVSINHKLAYIWSVSPTQINLQAPDDTATGPVDVVVVTKYGVAYSAIVLAPYGPSFSLLGDGRHAAGVIATPNGSGQYGNGSYDLAGPFGAFSFRTRPVKSGETLTLYGVGFGPTTPAVPAGQIFSGAAPTQNPVTIFIGGAQAKVAFSGITQSGLCQFNITVPNIPGGDQPLLATVNGIPTPPGVVIAIQ